jgi:hypothetical protein
LLHACETFLTKLLPYTKFCFFISPVSSEIQMPYDELVTNLLHGSIFLQINDIIFLKFARTLTKSNMGTACILTK